MLLTAVFMVNSPKLVAAVKTFQNTSRGVQRVAAVSNGNGAHKCPEVSAAAPKRCGNAFSCMIGQQEEVGFGTRDVH
jgi:hypothetical protein